MAKSVASMNPTREDFEALLTESYLDNPRLLGGQKNITPQT